MRTLLLLALLSVAAWGQDLARDFSLEEGGQQHFFLWTQGQRAHLLNRPGDRLVVAYPAGNSGVSLWFAEHTGVTVVGQPRVEKGLVKARLHCTGRLVIQEALLGSTRAIRDRQTERKIGKTEAVVRLTAGTLEFTRRGYLLRLGLPRGVKVEGMTLRSARPFDLELSASVPFPPLAGYTPQALFTPAALALLKRPDPRVQEAMRGLLFLSTRSKLMAGSWRFLTYFGRDTLLSAMLLEPAIRPDVYRNAISSVLDRLNPDGEVAHEEDLGDWVIARNKAAHNADLFAPIYDYKMVDDDFLLPIAATHLTPEVRKRFAPALDRNTAYVLRRAQEWQKMIPLQDGQSVGDWRDSNEGLGGGRYPSSVNVHLVPAALASLNADAELRRHWREVGERFQVHLTGAEVRLRLEKFVSELGPEEREFVRKRVAGPALSRGLSFTALSLDADGRPIEVMNTDDSFSLFLGEPDEARVDQFLDLLQWEYPVGLMTEVGPVVANPAYCGNGTVRKQLGRGAYHGAVVWSWQSAMIVSGLVRQTERFSGERRERILAAIARLVAAEKRAGKLAGSELWSIAPGPNGWKAVPFGAGTATSGDESNPVQLWSTVYPAVLLRLDALTR